MIEDALRGMRVWQLCDKYKLSDRQVSRILRDAATRVRDEAADEIAVAFYQQKERLERLYSIVMLEIEAYENYMLAVRKAQGMNPEANIQPIKFDDRPFRVAVAIFERQARLLGLDVGRERDTKGPTGWLDQAPIQQVVDYAKSLGMKTPGLFET